MTYARIYEWKPKGPLASRQADIDRWILSMLHKLIHQVEQGMDGYDLVTGCRALCRLCRSADQLVYPPQPTPLLGRSRLLQTGSRPLLRSTMSLSSCQRLPRRSSRLSRRRSIRTYARTRCQSQSTSADYPAYHAEMRDETLEATMAAVQLTVSLGHALRKEVKMKVRQPLGIAHIASHDTDVLKLVAAQQNLIAEELNVKQVLLSNDEKQFVSLKAKPNFRVLGKKVGKLMKAAQATIEQFDQQQLATLMKGGTVGILLEEEPIELTPEDVQVERVVHEGMVAANEGAITIALETALTDELLLEGLAREIVNKINTMRREGGFAVSDRINIRIDTNERVKACFAGYRDYIMGEVLGVDLSFGPSPDGTAWDLNGEPATISLTKI